MNKSATKKEETHKVHFEKLHLGQIDISLSEN